ncbi:DUF4242 domain-containing protein [Cohnella xylanilytica]|uniref:DUF4242 domain-containing protein n=1 Tax=Cohnella xylanilytica TaxID=557555 RepID=UPI001B2EAEBC|nr:DUF4242 domain-containing protein [Cohnella xylanilytica]GIO16599.1 DUF4242 domain-containing protein [Cohnella xylanilytica]
MTLYLVESPLNETVRDRAELERKLELAAQGGASLIEVQVAGDFSKAFFIFESEGQEQVAGSLGAADLPAALIKEVRLVGKELDEVKRRSGTVNYLVEWNFPEGLTMEQYLERKRQNSVHYAEVPEVSFARTYVCEDMTKCLCFYQAADEAAVLRARQAVQTPVDSITSILQRE